MFEAASSRKPKVAENKVALDHTPWWIDDCSIAEISTGKKVSILWENRLSVYIHIYTNIYQAMPAMYIVFLHKIVIYYRSAACEDIFRETTLGTTPFFAGNGKLRQWQRGGEPLKNSTPGADRKLQSP